MDEYKTFYLAYAIDQNTPDPPEKKVFDRIRVELLSRSYVIYEPRRAFRLDPSSTDDKIDFNSPIPQFIYRVNSFALKQADLRVFFITDAPSWGVPIELTETVNRGLPFILINLTKKKIIPHYLRVLLAEAKATKLNDIAGEPWFESLKDSLLDIVSWSSMTEDSDPFTWFSKGREE